MDDCMIIDKTIPVIDLDTTLETTLVGNPNEEGELEEECISEKSQAKAPPHILVTFCNEDLFKELSKELKLFLKSKRKDFKIRLDEENLEIRVTDKKKKSDSEDEYFMVDLTPSKHKHHENDNGPRYKRFGETLSDKVVADKSIVGKERFGNSCFNCDGNHSLRDCKEPKNYMKINKNRKNLMTHKTERYHVDLPQKYGHLKPGQISHKLRKALNLQSKELPVFIYKMRLLGYPPGWLEEAKVSHSGMNLIGSDGTVILESEDEDGEVDQVKDKYDAAKIIDYPGFNVDPPPDCYDDAKMYNCPPMMEQHRKEELLKVLGVKAAKAYKRRKMRSFPMNDSTDDVVAEDMDIEEGTESQSPTQHEFKAPETPTKRVSSDKIEDTPPTKVARLSSTNGNEKPDDSLIDFILERDANSSVSVPETTEEEKSKDSEVEPVKLASLSVEDGTPILRSITKFTKIPAGENWSVGVSDVLNFENLPDSVGKYEKMKEIIKKVQKHVKQINSEP